MCERASKCVNWGLGWGGGRGEGMCVIKSLPRGHVREYRNTSCSLYSSFAGRLALSKQSTTLKTDMAGTNSTLLSTPLTK